MKRLAAFLLAALSCGVSYQGASVNSPSQSNVVAAFDCRSFGQTASDNGNLNIKYATPIMCWATDSTVSGVPVNVANWVPEVWFDWNWDDNSLGTVSRGGLTVDLGKSIGLVAAHAFKPSTYAETCNGGTNSLHTVTLTVYSLVGGVRESDSATMTVCVEDPATTWPTPIAYCDDADCSNDTFTGVVNPGTPTHGGNGTDLATIMQKCDADDASYRILVEGGVTFSTASRPTVGEHSCLIESYGGSRAKLKFTTTGGGHAIQAEHANCAGYRIHNVTLAGNNVNGGPGLIGGADGGNPADAGCYLLLDSATSTTAGDQIGYISVVDPVGDGLQNEGYYIKFNYDSAPTNGIAQVYIYGRYTAFVGGSITNVNANPSAEHNMRMPQWHHFVLDATKLADQQYCRHSGTGCSNEGGTGAKSIITLRQDCGGNPTCTSNAYADTAALTRNELVAYHDVANDRSGTDPIELCTSGGSPEPTQCYDIDLLSNVFTYSDGPGANPDQYINFQGGNAAGTAIKRVRLFGNAIDMSSMTSTVSRFVTIGVGDDVAFIGNVLVDTSTATTNRVLSNGTTPLDISKNNGCFDAGNLCDMFPGITESADNVEVTSNPFSVSPGQFSAFDFSDVTISNGSAFDDAGVLPVHPTDVNGTACDSLYDVGPYCTP